MTHPIPSQFFLNRFNWCMSVFRFHTAGKPSCKQWNIFGHLVRSRNRSMTTVCSIHMRPPANMNRRRWPHVPIVGNIRLRMDLKTGPIGMYIHDGSVAYPSREKPKSELKEGYAPFSRFVSHKRDYKTKPAAVKITSLPVYGDVFRGSWVFKRFQMGGHRHFVEFTSDFFFHLLQ